MALAEFVGGPRDGEQFTVPGPLPPDRVTVMGTTAGPVRMWHPSRGNEELPVVVCHLEDEPGGRTTGPWRYRWPRSNGGPPARGGPPLL